MASRKKRWALFEMDELLKDTTNEQILNKKQSKAKKSSKQSTKLSTDIKKTNFNFFTIIQPECVEDLAVHPKKIVEVASWLDTYVLKPKKQASFLLISGPIGCGKLATVQMLCKKKFICIKEWTNPVRLPHFSEDSYDCNYMSQSSRFIEFVVESSYRSLMSASKANICIVKDFPNVLVKNPVEFETVLEKVSQYSNVSVIFIASDDSNASINIERILFGDEIKMKYNIGTISFNSCATTLMKGAIKRAQKLIQANLDQFKMPSDDVIEAICNASLGDIRCCMNQLYVSALKESHATAIDIKTETLLKPGAKRKRTTKTVTLKQRIKDETLGLFHSVGRVLNPKFDPVTNRISQNIEVILDEFATQPGIFLGFLHENYLKHFGDVGDTAEAAEAISLGQTFMINWVDRHETIMSGMYVAVMSLMLKNKHKISGFNPIRGPKKMEILPAKIQIDGMQFALSEDMCYYNSMVKGKKFQRFSFLPE